MSDTPVTVVSPRRRQDWKAFIELPWRIYRDDEHWVPRLRLERRLHFSRFNPFFRHGEWQAWLACRNGRPVGRICAQIDHLHRRHHQENSGHFGLLESINDSRVSGALFAQAEAWLAERGAEHITGPFHLSVNQECGLLVEGFDTPPAFMMPHSRPWYAALLEEQGYQPGKDLFAYWVEVEFRDPRIMQSLIDRYAGRVTVRSILRGKFSREMEVLRDIFNDAWSRNWGFVPFTREEFAELGFMLRWFLPEGFIQIAEVDGQPAAFMVSLPNLNEVLPELNGNLLPLGWLRLFRRLRQRSIRTGRIPLMGVRRRFQGTPLGMALAFMVIGASRGPVSAQGIHEVEMSWILEDNDAMRSILDSIGSKQYKRYRIYEKHLERQ